MRQADRQHENDAGGEASGGDGVRMEVNEPTTRYLIAKQQTELGELPADWSCSHLGGATDILTGFPFPSAGYSDSGTRLLRGSNVKRGRIEWQDELTVYWPDVPGDIKKYQLKAGDVVVAMDGSLVGRSFGALTEQDLPALLLQRVARIRSTQVEIGYLKHWICSERFTAHCDAVKTTTAIPHISPGDIRSFKVAVPPTNGEQQKIARALSDTAALIDSLEQLLTKKRQIKQGAMQELLTGKRRLPGFGTPWQNCPLNTLANIQRGASPRPIDDPVWFDDSSAVGWVRISDVTQSGMFLQATTQRLSDAGIRKSRFVRTGNLIMSICATVGRPVITALDTCIHDGFVVFDVLTVNRTFLYYALLNIEDDWSQHGQTGSQMNLNTGLINRTSIPVPDDVDEQAAIAQALSDIDADLAALESRLTKARALKQAMAQALLTGRIRLTEGAAA